MKAYLISLISLILFSGNSNTLAAQSNPNLANLLSGYYNIKNALVSGDDAAASKQAAAFSASLAAADISKLGAGEQKSFTGYKAKLAAGSKAIAGSRDLNKQRELFAVFSSDMISLAKEVKLSTQPVYIDYCPMKKASWLSAELVIKNPYYGSSMLNCGSVKETLN